MKRLLALSVSTLLAFCAAEGALRLGIVPGISIPRELDRREASVLGAARAYHWHGHLHVRDENDFRRAEPFPPRGARPRAVVVGDSFTYGEGVAAAEAYPALLEQQLGVEALNLGTPGSQSTQVLRVVERWTPKLEPDLVVYGVCLNDFQERGSSARRSPPSRFVLVDTVRLHLRPSFEQRAIDSLQRGEERFRHDTLRMRRLVSVPLIGMVLLARANPDALRVAAVAERQMREAGFAVVPVASYLPELGDRWLKVSRWERHPNAEAHRIYARALGPAIRKALGQEDPWRSAPRSE